MGKQQSQAVRRLSQRRHPQRHQPQRPLPDIVEGRSVDMRRQFMEEYFRPIAERLLQRDERVDAVMVAFAQYWDDNAVDAVHSRIIPLADRSLTLEEACTAKNLPFLHPFQWESQGGMIPRPEMIEPRQLLNDVQEELFGRRGYWDNYHLILAFASYTKEGCHQEMSTAEAYHPYALFVRSGDRVACHTVGEMLRPHLEDQSPNPQGDG